VNAVKMEMCSNNATMSLKDDEFMISHLLLHNDFQNDWL